MLSVSILFVLCGFLLETTAWLHLSPKTTSISLFSTPEDYREGAAHLIDAAASVTQESSPLLGVKSLGVDYGLVRTGVAVTVGYEPKPLAILQENVREEIIRMARAQQVSRIVVGLPLHKNGTVAEQTNLTLPFGVALAELALQELGPTVKVFWWDERYTSKEAAARVHSTDPGRRLQGTLDADAACIILESYYKQGGADAVPILVPDDVRSECIRIFESHQEEEQARMQSFVDERERRIQARKESIARATDLLEEQRNNGTIRKKKKKKKKKR